VSDCDHEWANVTTHTVRDENEYLCLKCKIRRAEPRSGAPEPPMIWTTEKPNKPGWYWWRSANDQVPRMIYHGSVFDRVPDGAPHEEPLAFLKNYIDKGEWAGPLEPPA